MRNGQSPRRLRGDRPMLRNANSRRATSELFVDPAPDSVAYPCRFGRRHYCDFSTKRIGNAGSRPGRHSNCSARRRFELLNMSDLCGGHHGSVAHGSSGICLQSQGPCTSLDRGDAPHCGATQRSVSICNLPHTPSRAGMAVSSRSHLVGDRRQRAQRKLVSILRAAGTRIDRRDEADCTLARWTVSLGLIREPTNVTRMAMFCRPYLECSRCCDSRRQMVPPLLPGRKVHH